MRVPAALLICVLLAACAATGPVSTEQQNAVLSPNQARIYFVRESATLYATLNATIGVDGKEVGTVGNGDHFFVDRDPGKYRVQVDASGSPRPFTAAVSLEAGKTYYLLVSSNRESAGMGAASGGVGATVQAASSSSGALFGLSAIDEERGQQLVRMPRLPMEITTWPPSM